MRSKWASIRNQQTKVLRAHASQPAESTFYQVATLVDRSNVVHIVGHIGQWNFMKQSRIATATSGAWQAMSLRGFAAALKLREP